MIGRMAINQAKILCDHEHFEWVHRWRRENSGFPKIRLKVVDMEVKTTFTRNKMISKPLRLSSRTGQWTAAS